MIIVGVKNKKVTFNQAFNEQYDVFKLIVKHNIFSHIKTGKKEFTPIEQITKEYLKQEMANDSKEDLTDPNDLDSSSIGYTLWFVAKCKEKSRPVSIRFGTPKISGRDHIGIDFNEDVFKSNFNELLMNFYPFLKELIHLVNPMHVVCRDYDLKNTLEDDDNVYGYIMYREGKELKEMSKGKDIELEKFGNGYLWKSDFSSYENGVASVIRTWKPNLL